MTKLLNDTIVIIIIGRLTKFQIKKSRISLPIQNSFDLSLELGLTCLYINS
jgi:hypothetical protein